MKKIGVTYKTSIAYYHLLKKINYMYFDTKIRCLQTFLMTHHDL